MEGAIKEIEQQERRAALERGDVDVWQQLGDAVIMGDSRAVGFSYYGYMEERCVLADGGDPENIPDYIAGLQNINPSEAFLCSGLNGISIGYWDTTEEHVVELDSVISLIKQSVSGVEVYVCSTIPAIDPAFARAEKWRDIPTWNTAIRIHCKEAGISYIDLTDTLAAHMDLYDPDGIHMQKAFIPTGQSIWQRGYSRMKIERLFLQSGMSVFTAFRLGLVVLLLAFVVLLQLRDRVSNTPMANVEAAVTASVSLDDMEKSNARMFKKFYGLAASDYESVVLYTPKTSMNAEELLLIKLQSTDQAAAAADACETRRQSQKDVFEGYSPEQYDLLENHYVLDVQGNYIFYMVGRDAERADRAFRDSL